MSGLNRTPAPGPAFYCDNNVHRLGRALRMLGYDTLLFGDGEDDELRHLRDRSGRILLTRDSDFEAEEHTLLLSSDVYLEQLRTVAETFELDVETYRYTLCLECNVTILPVETKDFADAVPEWVVKEERALWQCPDCLRLYWAGSHLDRMDERFERLFGPE